MTQEKQVLQHMKEHNFITSMGAIDAYGITRLADRIFNLRKKDYNIKTEMISKLNRYKKPVHFARYSLVK